MGGVSFQKCSGENASFVYEPDGIAPSTLSSPSLPSASAWEPGFPSSAANPSVLPCLPSYVTLKARLCHRPILWV